MTQRRDPKDAPNVINAADHIGLVHMVLREYRRPMIIHGGRIDFLSAGLEGLAHAALWFDPAKGNKFSTYACSCIRGYIKLEFRKMKLQTTQKRHGPRPVVVEKSLSDPMRIHKQDGKVVEFGDTLYDPEDTTGCTRLEDVELQGVVRRVLLSESKAVQTIMARSVFTDEPEKLDDIAADLGVTKQRVSQLAIRTKKRIIKETLRLGIVTEEQVAYASRGAR